MSPKAYIHPTGDGFGLGIDELCIQEIQGEKKR